MDIPLIKSGFLAKLGEFIFEPKGISFQKFDRETSFNWAELKRIGGESLRQFLGTNGERIAISGVVYPHFRGKLSQISDLRAMGRAGIPYQLIAADSESGQNLGQWIIISVKDGRTLFTDDGRPLKLEFTLELESYAQDP
ncbi:MAG: phage tail protein [Pseudobdellovibrionaceae bacterium]|nr:phage tail protein [Pseudobdellovibrionaceae bacterium]